MKKAIQNVSSKELENISGGEIAKEDFKNNVIKYTSEGSRVGIVASFALGGADA